MSKCPFDPKVLEVIEATKPTVAANAKKITSCFYGRLFMTHPALKSFFNQTHQAIGSQPEALAASIIAYATHIENLDVLKDALMFIAEKHIAYQVVPEQYAVVGENLLAAIKETLGVGDDVLNAWGTAYTVLADKLIEMEADLYAKKKAECGYSNWKDFTVTKVVKFESKVTELYMKPDEGIVPKFLPGMYVNVKPVLKDEDGIDIAPRSYSLSSYDEDCLRIGTLNEGLVSGWIADVKEGDKVTISPPCGTFVLDVENMVHDKVVLLAGGIGATPLVSMLHALKKTGFNGEVKYVQSSKNEVGVYEMDEVNRIAEEVNNISVQFRYTGTYTKTLESNEAEGRINAENLAEFVGEITPDTVCFICGPDSFGSSMQQMASDMGIKVVHCEAFGPAMTV